MLRLEGISKKLQHQQADVSIPGKGKKQRLKTGTMIFMLDPQRAKTRCEQ